MNKPPDLAALQTIKGEYIQAILGWLELPGRLFREGVEAKKTDRDPTCALVEKAWAKLRLDIWGTLSLIHSNHIGPAAALLRVCREQALWMMMWAFSDPQHDVLNRHYYYDVRRRKNAQRLKKHAAAFLEQVDLGLDERTRGFLENARQQAESILAEPDRVPYQGPVDKNDLSFAGLAKITATSLAKSLIPPDVVARQVVDYWLESEAVHGGSDALALYQPENFGLDVDRNGELTALARLLDIHPLTVIVNGAVLRVVGLEGELQRPSESIHLAAIAKRVELVVLAASE